MDPLQRNQFIQRINEIIFDEEKIVTFLSISSELKISLDDAKRLLEVFVEQNYKRDLKNFSITYLMYGTLKEKKGLAVYLVKEENIKSQEDLFSKVSQKIVYSVQKSKHIDYNMIALTNSTQNNFTGYLVSKNCVRRIFKNKSSPNTESSNEDVKPSKNIKTHSDVNQESVRDQPSQSQKVYKQRPSRGIASFFAKAAPTNSSNSNGVEKVEKLESSNKVTNGKVQEKKQLQEESTPNIVAAEGRPDVHLKKVPDTNSAETSAKRTHDQVNKKKRKKESKNNSPNKRRKRIQEICDSDSSDIFDDDDEDVIEKSEDEPEPEPVKILPLPKNKQRKTVDKTYVDEEGFIVTTTEYVHEEISDQENEMTNMNTKKSPKNETPPGKAFTNKSKTNKKPNSGKQSTLMNFFKKN